MATERRSDSEFADVVARARRTAAEHGELRPPRVGAFESPLPPEVHEVVAEWLRDGGYDAAIAEVSREDPELATE